MKNTRTPKENQKLAEQSLKLLREAVKKHSPTACIKAMELIELDPLFNWDDVSDDIFNKWDRIADKAVILIYDNS